MNIYTFRGCNFDMFIHPHSEKRSALNENGHKDFLYYMFAQAHSQLKLVCFFFTCTLFCIYINGFPECFEIAIGVSKC